MVNRNSTSLPLIMGNNPNIDAWLEQITHNHSSTERQAIYEAYQLAAEISQVSPNIPCKSLLYILKIVDTLVELGLESEVFVAVILYYVIENKRMTVDEAQKHFGLIVARLIDGIIKMKFIEKLDDYTSKTKEEENNQNENVRKMLLAMAEDVRVVLIKLAERLNQMRILSELPEEKHGQVAQETLDIFAPLANRLGIWQIKWELEDLSLRHLQPDIYRRMASSLDERRINREAYIDSIIESLESELKQAHIKASVSGRPKHIYSIWHKMQRKGLNVEQINQIFDVRAVRVLVEENDDCYRALGVIHNKWQPLGDEFDDYIAVPKTNGYQSLHTAVVGPENKIFEVQIRTMEMHRHAELGVASHWRYKEGGKQQRNDYEQKINWLRQMLKWRDEENSDGDFIDRFKSEIAEDRVYVLSPQGKIVDMPQGATPLDFAYYIHTELGHRCRGAKVNNRIVPLNYAVKNGEQVEILAGKEEKPSRDWLSNHLGYLKTTRARNKVKQWIKKQDTKQLILQGKILVERELRRLTVKEITIEQLAQHFNYASSDDFLAEIGRGDMSTSSIVSMINEQIFPKKSVLQIPPTQTSDGETGIYVKGVGSLLVRTGRCCNPVPNEPIIGYITQGRGVTIHHLACTNALIWQDEGNERLIEVEWGETDKQATLYPVDIQMIAYDRQGLLRDVTATVANEKINIIATHSSTNKTDNTVKMVLTLEVADANQLSRILAKLDNLINVIEVFRKI